MAKFIDVNISNFDLDGRGMRVKFKRASEKAFLFHRNNIMPKHFLFIAYDIYPEYREHKPKSRGSGLKRKTRTRKKDPRDQAKAKNRKDNSRSKFPLWASGRLRNAVLEGALKIFGSAGSTKMVWSGLPHYTFINPRGQINKVKALESIIPAEERMIANNIEKFLQLELEK